MVCGLSGALSVMVTVPDWSPTTVGVKVITMLQVALAARDVPQVLLTRVKGAVATMLVMVMGVVPKFVSVSVRGPLAVFTTWLPKFRVTVESCAMFTPVPNRLNVWGLFTALSLMLR